jgi:sporulation protein YlmC with PRC-barrel domain
MHRSASYSLAVLVTTATVLPALAADAPALRMSELSGAYVMGSRGAPVATISDIVADADGKVHYIVVERQTQQGDAPLAAIPWAAVEVTADGLAVDASGKQIAEAPGFSMGEWPDMTSTQWRAAVDDFYGVETAPDGMTAQEGESPLPPFAQVDGDGDGSITPDEAASIPLLSRQFEAADVDQSGTLDQGEFSAFETREGVMPGHGTSPQGGEPPPAGEQ